MRIHAIIEIAGFPKEHVEATMKEVVEKIKSEADIELLKADVAEAEEKEKIWSTFTELELRINNLQTLSYFCFNYMPSTIDILRPEKFDIEAEKITELLNDLLAKLHQYEDATKRLLAQNIVLKRKTEKN